MMRIVRDTGAEIEENAQEKREGKKQSNITKSGKDTVCISLNERKRLCNARNRNRRLDRPYIGIYRVHLRPLKIIYRTGSIRELIDRDRLSVGRVDSIANCSFQIREPTRQAVLKVNKLIVNLRTKITKETR